MGQKVPVGAENAQIAVLPVNQLRDGVQHQLEHGLRSGQSQFGLLAVRDVFHEPLEIPERSAAVPHDPGIERGRDHRAASGAQKHLALHAVLALPVKSHDAFPVALLKIDAGNIGTVVHQFPGARKAEHSGQGRIDRQPVAAGCGPENTQCRILEDGPVFFLGRTQTVLGLFAV